MNFTTTFSRSQLQAIPATRRLEAITAYVDRHLGSVVQTAAAAGKTSYLFVVPKNPGQSATTPPAYELTPDDLVEGIQAKFPECDVDFHEEWVDVCPGIREHRAGIKIDWS